MEKQQALIISAFPCVGKSYLSKIYKNVIDLETTYFQYQLTQEQKQMSVEELKATKKTEIENWLDRYIDQVKKLSKIKCILLVAPGKKIRKALHDSGLNYILVYPEKGLGAEYGLRAKNRGNNDRFIERITTTLDEQIESDFITDKNAKKHIVLKTGEYLTDALKKTIFLKDYETIEEKTQ